MLIPQEMKAVADGIEILIKLPPILAPTLSPRHPQ